MRIISKFIDYYDSCQAEGIDKSLIFQRVMVEHAISTSTRNVTKNPLPKSEPIVDYVARMVPRQIGIIKLNDGGSISSISPGFVVFAGKFYPYARIAISGYKVPAKVIYTYSLEDLIEIISPSNFDLSKLKKNLGIFSQGSWTSFLSESGSDFWLPLMTEIRIPILSWESSGAYSNFNFNLIENPKLSDIEFFKAINSWQAFQELSMFLGGLAAPERETVIISDKDKVAQFGFDKWSFRKMPGQK